MLRGTRILSGRDVDSFNIITQTFRRCVDEYGYEEVIFPSIWEEQTFTDKAGKEITSQLWNFKDKGDRNVTLIPEVTALAQEQWRDHWSKECKRKKIFYLQKCYRYERPQLGRYREFWQFGVENLGPIEKSQVDATRELLMKCISRILADGSYTLDSSVKRGLHYYTDLGFEVSCPSLGAQKQIAGGGVYKEGVGWAIGVDRVMIASQQQHDGKG